MRRIKFVSRISKRGKNIYYINIPKKYHDFAKQHHGKDVIVEIIVIENEKTK